MATAMETHGRAVIYTDADEINASNVAEVLKTALNTHTKNSTEIEYLWGYYKGDQPILTRTKDFNANILNKIVQNRAYEITNFKTGYLLSAPLQYTAQHSDMLTDEADEEESDKDIVRLSSWMQEANKQDSDAYVANWQSICGTAFRMLLPKEERLDDSEPPFDIFDLDPRVTFVVYSSKLGHKPMLGVTYVTLEDESYLYYCYTDTEFFTIDKDDVIIEHGGHILSGIPIIEYPADHERMGDFEVVTPLLDAINSVQSDRVDSTEQFVQAILVMKGFDVENASTAEFMTNLKQSGGLFLPEEGDAKYVSLELNQAQTQTLVNDMNDAILQIVGMPNRNGGSSTSDTGAAVILRDGWSAAESRAVKREIIFKSSERRFLKLAVTVCNAVGGTNLMVQNIGIQFPRRNYTNDSANVSNLVTMLSSDWVRPEFAYEHSNLTPDPHREWLLAKKWHDSLETTDVNNAMRENGETETPEIVETLEPIEEFVDEESYTE